MLVTALPALKRKIIMMKGDFMSYTFNFEEVCFINQLITTDDKEAVMKEIDNLIPYTENDTLKKSLISLSRKLITMDNETFRRIYSDKINGRVLTCPMYSIE